MILQNNKIKAFNTDGEGFIKDLKEKNIFFVGKKVLILGAGGSARSIVNSLSKINVEAIDILSRTQNKVENLTSSNFKQIQEVLSSSLQNCRTDNCISSEHSVMLKTLILYAILSESPSSILVYPVSLINLKGKGI